MRVLGVDPGTYRMGVGVIEADGDSLRWLASDEAAYISGAVIPVDGGLGMGH